MSTWTELMRSELRDLRISGKIVFGSGAEFALSGDHIAEITIEEGADGALLPGDVLSAVCRADLANDRGQWLPGGSCLGGQELIGATFMPEITFMDGGTEITRPLGVFQVEKAVVLEKEARLRITASDSISFELGGTFLDRLSYPKKLSDIWRYAVSQTRYVFSGDVPNGSAIVDSAPEWKGISVRQALGYIAAAAGCFVCVDRNGNLRLRRVWNEDEARADITSAAYIRLESDSASFGPVDALSLVPMGEEAAEKMYYASAEQTHIYPVAIRYNPLFVSGAANLDILAQGMLSNIAGYSLSGLHFDWRGDPEIGVGSKIALNDTAGRRLEGVITRQTMKYAAGFSASCSCSLPENSETGIMRAITPEGGLNASALVGTVDGGLISAKSITAIKLAADSVTAEKLAAGAVDAQAISAIAGKVMHLTAEDIFTNSLAAALAQFTVITAGTAEFDRATAAHLVSQALNLQFGTADQVYIKNLAVEYAQMVGAAIGDLCIRASDGNYYNIDVDTSGNVIATAATLSEGEIASGRTDAGSVILETNITAANLNASNLLATYALINQIDAARIDVDQLFAREAFVNALVTSRIFADGGSLALIAQSAGEVEKWFQFTNDRGLIIRKPEYTDGEGTVHPASIWYTVTDETGYHIFSTQQTQPVGSFQRGGLNTSGVRIGDIVSKRTSSGGWVWTDAI